MAIKNQVEEAIPVFSSKIPATAVIIMDDFLSPPIPEEEIDRIDEMKDKTVAGKYNWAFKGEIEEVSADLYRFYKKAVDVMGLDEAKILGIEFWINTFKAGDGIHMHSDLDETLYRRTRRMECAIAGTMCFAATHDLKGGSFVFEDGVTVRPRRNRAVMFFGGTRHGVEPVTHGVRKAVLVAFWHRMPTAHREAAAVRDADR
jgi:hypothetical protein